jgi:cobalt-zinc-cadmium efflux system protein
MRAQHRRRLSMVLGITLTVLVIEVVGGVVAGSLALLADAGHMLADAAGIGLALLAGTFAARPATPKRTFGFQRAEILAVVVNSILLCAVATYVLVEAVVRFAHPPAVSSVQMLSIAAVAVLGNGVCLLLLRDSQAESLNVRGAYLEVLGDLLGSLAVVIAAVIILATGFQKADALASGLIGVLILARSWGLLREAVDVLLEATPKGVNLAHVRDHIEGMDGIVEVHDLHAWTITSGVPVLSAHIVVDEAELADGGNGRVLDRLADCLGGHFDVEHCTFQLEPAGHRAHEAPAHHA